MPPDELTDISIGERVRFYRGGRRQDAVAGLAEITVEYLRMIERGTRVPTIGTLYRLARVLGVRVSELLGEAQFQTDAPEHIDAMIEMQRALTSFGDLRSDVAPRDIEGLRHRVSGAWTTWHSSPTRFTEIGRTLPAIIVDAEAMLRRLRAPAEANDRREVQRLLSDAYALAQEFCRRVGRSDLNLLAADRAVRMAEEADDELRMLKGKWNIAHALLGDNQPEACVEVATRTAEELQPRLAETPPDYTAMYCLLYLTAIRGAARRGDLGTARRWLNEQASPAAQRTGDRFVLWAASGPRNITIHAVGLEMEAGEAAEGLRLATAVDVDGALTIERKTTALIDLARCYDLRREDAGVLLNLTRAERISPEDVRYHKLTHNLVRGLLKRVKPSYAGEVRALATRIGVLA